MAKKIIYLSGSTAVSPKKKNFYKIFGVLLVFFSGYQIYNYIIEQTFSRFNTEVLLVFVSDINFLNAVILFCIAVGLLFTGFQLIGRKTDQYIKFEKNKIIYKPSFLKDSKSVNIDELKEIVYSPTWILCISDKEKFMIDLSWVSSHIASRVKKTIKEISAEKQINMKGQ